MLRNWMCRGSERQDVRMLFPERREDSVGRADKRNKLVEDSVMFDTC